MNVKKHLALWMIFSLLLSLCSFSVMAAEENLLKNGSFEEVSDGLASGWGLNGAKVGEGFEIATEGAADGKNAVHFKSDGNNMYVSCLTNVVSGEEYVFSAKLKTKGSFGADGPAIKVTYQMPDGKGSYTTLDDIGASFKTKRQGAWEEVTYKSKASEGATRVILLVRLVGSGECWWDDVKFTGKKPDSVAPVTPPADSGPALTAPADDAYPEADKDETQKFYLTKQADGTFDLLKNGDFEVVAQTGLPQGWGLSGGKVYSEAMVAKGDAPSGENFFRFFGETSSVFTSNTITNVVVGETYTFSAYLRKMPGTKGTPQITLVCQKPSGNTHADVKTFYQTFDTTKVGQWEKVEYTLEVPEETTRIGLLVRLVGGGEVHWDNIHFVGKADKQAELESEFRAMLAEEKEKAGAEVSNSGVVSNFETPFPGQPDNILPNGNFDENDGTNVSGWTVRDAHKNYCSLEKGAGPDGSDAIHLNVPTTDALKNPFYQRMINIVGGAEYMVSFRYKRMQGSTGYPAIKLEFAMDRSLPGAVACGEKYVSVSKAPDDNEWHTYSAKVYPPSNAAEATVLARLMQNGPGQKAEIYIDDVKIFMTNAPATLALTTDEIFYYDDMLHEMTTFSGSVNLAYYPEFASAKMDFAVSFEGKNIWEEKQVTATNGTSTVAFPLSLLTEKEKPYQVKATLYNADGSVKDTKIQNIYVYARPNYLGKDGVYMKNGKEPFYPVYAYHVKNDHYKMVAEAGINLVQMGAFGSGVETALAALDAAQEAGIMGFICLYNGMKPAGHEDNITHTIKLLSDERIVNHPALFGYGVMDEVFLGLSNPEADMEASFRLIRALDPNHPIMCMEAVGTYYEKCAKFVDVLCIDPYSSAQQQNGSKATERARAAVKYRKPVYTLLEAYYTTHGRWPLPEDGRNNNWQALIAGANCVGYYSISDSDADSEGKWTVPIWDARDGGALYNALKEFGTVEKKIAYDHFVFDKSPEFNEARLEDYWYSAWHADGGIYMIVLGMKENQQKEISIPLESFKGDVKIGAYTAEIIAGREDKTPITGEGALHMTVNGVEAVLYKITPNTPVDFSALDVTRFEDLENYSWARQQIAKLDALGIIDGRNDWEFAPDENITRAEFAGFLIRALGLTADSTELFADVPASHPYAKEIAIGRALGILKGTDGVNYMPEAEISRQDLMVISARGMRLKKELEAGDASQFADAASIADYAVLDIAAMVRANIVTGYEDGTVRPKGNTTRAEAAVIMERIMTWAAN